MFVNKNLFIWLLCCIYSISSPAAWAGLLGDTCVPVSGIFNTTTTPYIGNDTINISDAFINADTYSVTLTTNWNGKMWCTYGGVNDDVYYYSPMHDLETFYIGFSSSTDETDATKTEWFRVAVSLNKNYQSVNGLPGIHTLGYQSTYTLTFTPATNFNSSSDVGRWYRKTSTGSLIIVPVVAAGDKQDATNANSAWLNSSWGKGTWLSYQNLTITYQPNQTTCSIPDQTVNLPETSIDAIRNGRASRRLFALSFSCGGTYNGVATRNVTSWFYSADIVSTDPYVLSNSSSTAQDVGIMITDYWGTPISLSNSQTSIQDAELLLDIEKGKTFDTSETAYPFATYAIYGSNPQPGRISATATVIIKYD